MVMILSAAFTSPTRIEHERITSPLMCTEQAPHCATPQPYLVPVRPTCSRMTHSSGVSGSTCTSRIRPLMLSFAIGALRSICEWTYTTRSASSRHGQRVTGDIARLVRGQEQHGVGDLEGLAQPLQRRHVIGAVLDRLVQ